jgi:hypothetical protein
MSESTRGEAMLGAAWWTAARAWGALLTAVLLLAPLLLANLVAELFTSLPATAALLLGVLGAYTVGLPPWDGEERHGLLLVIGGSTASVVGWDLLRGSADVGSLLVALALTVLIWPVRRALARRSARRLSP